MSPIQEWLGSRRLRGQLQWLCSLNRWAWDAAIAAIAWMEGDAYDGEILVKFLVKYGWNHGYDALWWWNTSFYTAISLKLWVYDWYCCAYQATTLHWNAVLKTRCSKQANTNWNLENRQQKGTCESHENLLIYPKIDSWGVPVPSLLVNGKAKHWRAGDSTHSTVVQENSYIVHGWQ